MGVTAVCPLPEGRLAWARWDDEILVWDVQTRTETSKLVGHTGEITALCILSDGRIASSSQDGTIRLWNAEAGVETACLVAHEQGGAGMACPLPDGQLASAGEDGTIRIWDVRYDAKFDQDGPPKEGVGQICLLPNGRLASASGSNGGTIWLSDAITGDFRAKLEGHRSGITSLFSLPDGRLVSSSWDKTTRVWDVDKQVAILNFPAKVDHDNVFAVLPDRRLAFGIFGGDICLWDVNKGIETGRLKGHGAGISALCLLPDGQLASAADEMPIRIWSLKTARETARIWPDGLIAALCLMPDGRLVSASWAGTIQVWDTATTVETMRLDCGEFRINSHQPPQPGGLPAPGYRGRCEWTRNGERVGWIQFRREGNGLVLSYRVRRHDEEWREVDQFTPIVWTPCRFGGQRPYFVCPGVIDGVACGRQMAKLSGAGTYFLCRHCYRLAYASQREGSYERALRRGDNIRLRLGGRQGDAG